MVDKELCDKAVQAFINALVCYLRSNALRTVKIASLTGQNEVKVSLRAFMRCHDSSLGFVKVRDVVDTLIACSGDSWVRKLGWGYVSEGEEPYFIVPLRNLVELVQWVQKDGGEHTYNLLLRKMLGPK